jgi:hypothetical protein
MPRMSDWCLLIYVVGIVMGLLTLFLRAVLTVAGIGMHVKWQ